ncbi:uncharacterized protein EI90DRAFT_856989 [Cantharellus anzutake]|uniref:uncharacterized protein n=1 Tax=Cantharellus anzutake TaxID=1750568 RepID=UPI0019031EA6|nr:uncharacterized protein EI90DRAFT_856989 [Cantharellus anzutake]KAF8332417.1 hypothetical protein EI90DRAFT_856989 [Cantharellus anzutake]
MSSTSASATSTHSNGLQLWVNETRRQLALATQEDEFTHYVQSNGFNWLASYVQGVLSDESIVELAKTPGRQKSARKTRSHMVAKAASAVKLKSINDQLQREKEFSKPLSPIYSPKNFNEPSFERRTVIAMKILRTLRRCQLSNLTWLASEAAPLLFLFQNEEKV